MAVDSPRDASGAQGIDSSLAGEACPIGKWPDPWYSQFSGSYSRWAFVEMKDDPQQTALKSVTPFQKVLSERTLVMSSQRHSLITHTHNLISISLAVLHSEHLLKRPGHQALWDFCASP